MASFLDVCRFNPTAGGTTDWTYSSAATGYQSPTAAGVVNGRIYKYRAESNDLSQWEVGEGAYNTGTGVLARTTVLYNSSGTTSKINFSAAPQVAVVALSGDLPRAFGQCRLTLSGGNLVLSPFNGNFLTINGQICVVPDAGVSLAATSLSVGTTYMIYAYLNSGTMTLEASTTAHATSTTAGNKGVEIKSGDETRSLVGMARVVTGPAWVDSGSQRFVLSYFNRSGKNSVANCTATRSVTNASFAEFNSELRAEFLTWADEIVTANLVGGGYVGTANQAGFWAIGFDGTTAEPGMAAISDGTAGALRPVAFNAGRRLSEGYHYATALGGGNASTAVNLYFSSASDGLRSSMLAFVRG